MVSALRRAGFEIIRIKGSHYFMRHADGRSTVVPVHRAETIGPGLAVQILRDCDMTVEELIDLL